jgi:small multidrug resistance pump
MEVAAAQSTMGWIIGGSLAFSVGAAFMKSAQGFTRIVPSTVVAVMFLIGAIFVTRAVMTESLSTAIIVGLGIEAVLSLLIGLVLFREQITLVQSAGMGLIIVGVGMLRLVG